MFLFSTFSLSLPLGFTLHCSSCRLAASMYRIHIHTEHSNTWTYGFSHTLPSVTTREDVHTLWFLSHPDICCSDCCPLGYPHRQQSSSTQPLSLSCGDLRSWRPCITLLETNALVFWHCLHPCGPRALSPFQVYSAIH